MTDERIAQPTPGPWVPINLEGSREWVVWSGGTSTNVGTPIAWIDWIDRTTPDHAAQEAANAHLIAAAPELLAELERLHEQIAAHECGEYVDWSDNLLRIQAVLAKAEGREP